MAGPWMEDDELPRFVALLRMAHGPVERDAEHCGEPMTLEELEEFDEVDENAPSASSARARCIMSCRDCGHVAWAWFD